MSQNYEYLQIIYRRKRRIYCVSLYCPHIYCGKCALKMLDQHGSDVFSKGCPVCLGLCCCANKTIDCKNSHHCYRKCPASIMESKREKRKISSIEHESDIVCAEVAPTTVLNTIKTRRYVSSRDPNSVSQRESRMQAQKWEILAGIQRSTEDTSDQRHKWPASALDNSIAANSTGIKVIKYVNEEDKENQDINTVAKACTLHPLAPGSSDNNTSNTSNSCWTSSSLSSTSIATAGSNSSNCQEKHKEAGGDKDKGNVTDKESKEIRPDDIFAAEALCDMFMVNCK